MGRVQIQFSKAADKLESLSYQADDTSSEENGIPGQSKAYLVGQKTSLDSVPGGLDLAIYGLEHRAYIPLIRDVQKVAATVIQRFKIRFHQ